MSNNLSLFGKEFTVGHGNRACLLLHGFGCGPIQMRELGEILSTWGFTARGILLPGHCETNNSFTSVTFHDWQKKVEAEYLQLTYNYKEVVVIGFSLGALLTLHLASHYPIERTILLSTPLFIIRKYLPMNCLIDVCKIFIKRVKPLRRRYYIESEAYSGHVHFPIETHFPLQAVYELKQLMNTVKPRLKDIRSSTLVIHSRKDITSAPASAHYVLKHLGSSDKRIVWLKRSHHVVMYDQERHVVFEAIRAFLLENTQKTSVPVP